MKARKTVPPDSGRDCQGHNPHIPVVWLTVYSFACTAKRYPDKLGLLVGVEQGTILTPSR